MPEVEWTITDTSGFILEDWVDLFSESCGEGRPENAEGMYLTFGEIRRITKILKRAKEDKKFRLSVEEFIANFPK